MNHDYSTKKTVKNLDIWTIFTLDSNKIVLSIKDDSFQKWDQISITDIDDRKHDSKLIHFVITRDWKTTDEYKLSWWVFLKAFIDQIDQNLVVTKEIDNWKTNIKRVLNDMMIEKIKKTHKKN